MDEDTRQFTLHIMQQLLLALTGQSCETFDEGQEKLGELIGRMRFEEDDFMRHVDEAIERVNQMSMYRALESSNSNSSSLKVPSCGFLTIRSGPRSALGAMQKKKRYNSSALKPIIKLIESPAAIRQVKFKS